MASADARLKMVIPSDPWVQAVADGRASIPGYTCECASDFANSVARFEATAKADVGENLFRRLLTAHAGGAKPSGLPVFFTREHMQRNLLVLRGSNLHHPTDLLGKRVGCSLGPGSSTMTGTMMMLEQAHGVPLGSIEWRVTDIESLPVNRMGLDFRPTPHGLESNVELLRKGSLDAVQVPTGARYWSMFDGDPKIRRITAAYPDVRPLVEDPANIADAFHRTGLYPITDLAVVHREAVDGDPKLPSKLFRLFSEANALASSYRDAEEEALAQKEMDLLGADPYVYGLTESVRHNLSTYADFLYRLGSIDVRVAIEEILLPVE